MITKLKTMIETAFNNSTSPGLVVCDCDANDVFYVPESGLEDFMAKDALTDKHRNQIQDIRETCEMGKELVAITFQRQAIVNISKFEKGGTLLNSCTIVQTPF